MEVFDSLHPDRPHDECGVFGIWGPGMDVARLAYFGLFALQHRGQESAGISVADVDSITTYKEMGLVTQVFHEEVLSGMRGHAAIGHTRYSTTGSSVLRNAQPIQVDSVYGPIAVAHNGNLLNAVELRQQLQDDGVHFRGTNDSEIIARMIAHEREKTLTEAVVKAMQKLEGAYALTILSRDAILGVRDRYGIRPLCLGRVGENGWVLASETCALRVVGAGLSCEVQPGEIVVVDSDGPRTIQALPDPKPSLCAFEFIYLARPDSNMYGVSLHLARRRMGMELAKEHPTPDADIVIPIPDTAIAAAIGYAEGSGIPYGEGVIKSRYIHRTFIQPDQRMREMGVRMKLTPLPEVLHGKNVVMVDDSIVRGTTTGSIVKLLRDAGAKSVHVRISSPPITYPCFYGVDMCTQRELIAANKSVEEIRTHIGADTLGYLSPAGLIRACGGESGSFCQACFIGQYPIQIPEGLRPHKFAMEPGGDHVEEGPEDSC
ncbi:MAG TPA: amidophosphoribosyltransferase [Armatimonadota bacterium]|jgi:amidophosphoribosyltransferase